MLATDPAIPGPGIASIRLSGIDGEGDGGDNPVDGVGGGSISEVGVGESSCIGVAVGVVSRDLGIDTEGNLVWQSETRDRERRIQELLESESWEDQQESIELLEQQVDDIDDGNEQNRLALKLGDACWDLAKSMYKE